MPCIVASKSEHGVFKVVASKRLVIFPLLAFLMSLAMPAAATTPQYKLLNAVEDGDVAEVTKLLREGVSPDTRRRGTDGTPAIVIAAQEGHFAVMKLLLDNNANPNLADRLRGQTALMHRAVVGDTNMIQLLLSYGADSNRADIGQETALMKAVRGRKFKAAQALIEGGADPNVQDLTGKTALEYARISRSRRFVRLLQDAGATY